MLVYCVSARILLYPTKNFKMISYVWQYSHVHVLQVVHFRALEKPREDDFCLEL